MLLGQIGLRLIQLRGLRRFGGRLRLLGGGFLGLRRINGLVDRLLRFGLFYILFFVCPARCSRPLKTTSRP